MQFTTKAQAKKLTGLNYLGSVNMTTKHKKATAYHELTYSLYLAPAKLSGYEVCAKRNKECTSLCLNESGMNRMSMKDEAITKSRIAKTKLFFEHREFFMAWLIDEITTAHIKARTLGYKFSVRLNNTSDISPAMFYVKRGVKSINILELFPAVQFYDYTKVLNRIELTKKYSNYDLTFSYSGYNINECQLALESGVRVAVVFKQVPSKFWGLKVIDGDAYDMRYHDKKNVIVGLKFKTVRTKLNKKIKFVVQ